NGGESERTVWRHVIRHSSFRHSPKGHKPGIGRLHNLSLVIAAEWTNSSGVTKMNTSPAGGSSTNFRVDYKSRLKTCTRTLSFSSKILCVITCKAPHCQAPQCRG